MGTYDEWRTRAPAWYELDAEELDKEAAELERAISSGQARNITDAFNRLFGPNGSMRDRYNFEDKSDE